MASTKTLQHADLYFRSLLDVAVPLHRCLVEEMCQSGKPPLELATRLEDIGQAFIAMAQDLAGALIDQGRMADEPDPDDYAEARISKFAKEVIEGAGELVLEGGVRLDGAAALSALPIVSDSIKTALWVARADEIARRETTA
ncbi:hypothetical protein [Methylorubrum sp. SB2]|uniref:hypothetical protein n=1 Tax=Methylorubrum subtropicum TaxID=3138812 RepID=UPI00313C0549